MCNALGLLEVTTSEFYAIKVKMNLILYLIAIEYFCFGEINCRSIHIDRDAISGIEMNEDKSLNQDQENRGKMSWKKLKPILLREVQRIRTVNGKFLNCRSF